MQKVLVDSCGWVAIVDAGIHLDLELGDLVGNFELALLPKVETELSHLQQKRSNTLLLDLLMQKSTIIPSPSEAGNHTDDQLVALAVENSWPVITIDSRLKARLMEAGCQVIEVAQKRRLKIIQ